MKTFQIVFTSGDGNFTVRETCFSAAQALRYANFYLSTQLRNRQNITAITLTTL